MILIELSYLKWSCMLLLKLSSMLHLMACLSLVVCIMQHPLVR